MKLPQAFHSRRVTEALSSLAVHVAAAYDIAASLDPARTLRPELRNDEDGRVVLHDVEPRHCRAGESISLVGTNLNRIEEVWLEPEVARSGEEARFRASQGTASKGRQQWTVDRNTREATYRVVLLTEGERVITPFTVRVVRAGGNNTASPA